MWLANVQFPDESIERFDTPVLPAGWSTSGDAPWSVTNDPAYAYGVGRYAMQSGDVADNQVTAVRSPTINTDSLNPNRWIPLGMTALNSLKSRFHLAFPFLASSGCWAP